MKRLTSLIISGLFAISLAGCNSQAPNTMFEQSLLENTVNSQSLVNKPVRSDAGLRDFVSIMQKKVFDAYDANHDRYVSADEFSSLGEFFSEIDLDKNGKASYKEAIASKFFVFDTEAEESFERQFEQLVFEKMIDADSDGNASKSEYLGIYLSGNPSTLKSKYFKTLFTKNDINKDGILTFGEYEDASYQLLKRDIVVELIDGGLIIHFKGYDKSLDKSIGDRVRMVK